MTCLLSVVWTLGVWSVALTPPGIVISVPIAIHDAATGDNKLMRTMPAFRGCRTQ